MQGKKVIHCVVTCGFCLLPLWYLLDAASDALNSDVTVLSSVLLSVGDSELDVTAYTRFILLLGPIHNGTESISITADFIKSNELRIAAGDEEST